MIYVICTGCRQAIAQGAGMENHPRTTHCYTCQRQVTVKIENVETQPAVPAKPAA